METEDTRALILRFNSAREANDVDVIRSLLAEDAEWYPPRSVRNRPYRGRDRIATGLTGGNTGTVLDVASIERTVLDMIVESDRAVVRQRMTARRLDGAEYENDYCWIYACRDGLVTTLTEYGDTLLIARAGFIPLEPPATDAIAATKKANP